MAAVAAAQMAGGGCCPRAEVLNQLSAFSPERLGIPNSRRLSRLTAWSVEIQDQE